jgi:hypothetical protein
LAADDADPGALLAALRPRSAFYMEADDVRRNREIVDRIRSRHHP